MICSFWAFALSPVALVTAIGFSTPLLATIGAAFLDGEKVGRKRWLVVVAGFVGVLFIIRPGPEGVTAGLLLALASALFAAGDWHVLKPLAKAEPARTVAAWLAVLMVPLTFVPMLIVWKMPSAETFFWLIGLSLSATLAQIAVTRSFVSAFYYTQLIFTVAVGWVLFDEAINAWTFVGAVVIATAGGYIARSARDIKSSWGR